MEQRRAIVCRPLSLSQRHLCQIVGEIGWTVSICYQGGQMAEGSASSDPLLSPLTINPFITLGRIWNMRTLLMDWKYIFTGWDIKGDESRVELDLLSI